MSDQMTTPTLRGPLLSRYAECLVWMARYIERIENLARIVDVTDGFSRQDAGESGWLSVLNINADAEKFFKRNVFANSGTVTNFYILDRDNPTSIANAITQVRENARTLRPLISTEMWQHINVFYGEVRGLTQADIAPSRLSGVCAMLKEGCQMHTGITEGTFFRDQGWIFYAIGKYMERADQITRLVDIKYHTILPEGQEPGSATDVNQWFAVLRAAAGYHAFRRVFPRDVSPGAVVGFLLLNHAFPRSLVLSLQQIEAYISQLRSGYGLHGGLAALERLDDLRGRLSEHTPQSIILVGLHEFMDNVQQDLMNIQKDIAADFWPVPDVA